MEKSSGLGNEQETRLAWLAGIIDGEGSFGINKQEVEGKRFRLYTYFCVANTDARIILQVIRILDGLGCEPYIMEKQPNGFNLKAYWDLRVNAQVKLRRLLDAVRPYLIGKAAQADLVIRYLDRRLVQGTGRGHTFNEKDMEFYHRLRALNRRGSSETTRAIPSQQEASDAETVLLEQGEDIVHASSKDGD